MKMSLGKILAIVAAILVALLIVFTVIEVNNEPELPDDFYELMLKDQEAALQMEEKITDNASPLYKISSTATTICGWGAILLSIVSLVIMIKNKEKGKVWPILLIISVIVIWILSVFISPSQLEAFQAGLKAGMEMTE